MRSIVFSAQLFLLAIIGFNWTFVCSGWCAEPINISSYTKRTSIGDKTDILIDTENRLTVADLILPRYEKLFKPNSSSDFRLGLSNNVVWLRFKIKFVEEEPHSKMLILGVDKGFPHVDLYLPDREHPSGAYKVIKTGSALKNEGAPLEYRYSVFELPDYLPPNQFVYMRIKSFTSYQNLSLNFSAFIEDKEGFIKKSWLETYFLGVVVGILGAMLFYNLFLYITLKDKVYGLYVVYVVFILLYIIFRKGLGVIFGVPGSTVFIIHSVSIAFVFALIFTRYFLHTMQYCPILDTILLITVGFSLLAAATTLCGMPKLGNTLMHAVAVIGSIVGIAAGVQRSYQGYSPAGYYLYAWIFMALGTTIAGMLGFGLIQKNFITSNAVEIGSSIEAILLSLALAYRIAVLRKEKIILEKKERRLVELSITDELTGLYNKRWFLSKLRNEREHCRQESQQLSLMVLDVDHFKQFNDNYGHATGDKVLAQLGKILRSSVRESDIACRYGGEEFSIIMPLVGLKLSIQIAERIRQNFEKFTFTTDSGEKLNATISIGVAESQPFEDEEQLFERADKALYQAKSNGRNQVVSG